MVKMKKAPAASIARACPRWVCIWSALITAPARSGTFSSRSRKTGISFVFLTLTGSWAAVVPSSQIPDSSIGARRRGGAAHRLAVDAQVLSHAGP